MTAIRVNFSKNTRNHAFPATFCENKRGHKKLFFVLYIFYHTTSLSVTVGPSYYILIRSHVHSKKKKYFTFFPNASVAFITKSATFYRHDYYLIITLQHLHSPTNFSQLIKDQAIIYHKIKSSQNDVNLKFLSTSSV